MKKKFEKKFLFTCIQINSLYFTRLTTASEMVASKSYSRFRKYAKTARKGIRSAAKTYLNVARSGAVKNYRKTGKWSSTAIAKSLSNLQRKVGASSEYKTIEDLHTTGSPDVTLRQYFDLRASALQATLSTTTTPGTSGYFLQQVTHPTRGDGLTNFDGKRFSVESIQWKGTLHTAGNSHVRLMIVRYMDEDMDPFQMNEFLRVDNNSEYSTQCKYNYDFKGYKVLASRNYRLSPGSNQRRDFNIMCRPKNIVKLNEDDDSIFSCRYFCVALISPDIGSTTSSVLYMGSTRMHFIH